MTLRAKPVVRRSRSPWASDDRRNFLLSLGFGLVVVLSIGILALAAGATWYEDNFGQVAKVNGETITRSDFRDRLAVENLRVQLAESQVRTEQAAGRLTDAQAQSQLESLSQRRQQLPSAVIEQLIDAELQSQLAAEAGVSVTDEQVSARIAEESTTPARRHLWAIEISPEITAGAAEPTPAQVAAARERAEQARADIEGGESFQDVATAESDGISAAQGGDLGWIFDGDATFEPAFVEAAFTTETGALTEVIEGEDGIFRVGMASEALPEAADPTYEQRIIDSGVAIETYREVVRTEVLRTSLEEHVAADYLVAGPQRRVDEIYIAASGTTPPEGAVKTRHILYSPNNDPGSASTVELDDPAWDEAEERAQAAYDILKNDISRFDAIARRESSENQARFTGGKLPFFDPSSGIDAAFGDAIFAEGLEDGELLEPVRSSFGWHIIQIMYRPPDIDQLTKLKREIDGGQSFASRARDFSESQSSADGGALGWVARGQLDDQLIEAIMATPIGSTSEILDIEGDGLYLFKVHEEETRTPDEEQEAVIRQRAFPLWYQEAREAATIERNPDFLTSGA